MPSIFHAFLSKIRDSITAAVYNKLYYSERAQQLTYLALSSREKGVTEGTKGGTEIIVSLTTHGRRLYDVYLGIESIMQGSVKPNRIVLWLSKDLQTSPLPQTLLNQIDRGLLIKYTEDIGPYTKLVPALKEYPDSVIVTIDDDILYPFDTLEMLVSAYRKQPKCIVANRVMDIALDNQGHPTSLPTWKELEDKDRVSKLNFFEGVGAVLYPPHCFTADVLDQSVFTKICPTADDVWFNCMALLSRTSVVPANHHYSRFPLLINESVQDSALWRINSRTTNTLNDNQLRAVMGKYNLSYAE
jgi:hypothetical protein